jgi:alpha-tubulin suppressor-like RCC1 family protein
VWCWGTGASLVAEPVQLQPATTLVATEVSAGWDHACARLANGQARCWGSDSDGQLGDGAGNPARPFVVLNARVTRPLGGVVHVDAGDFVTCAVVAGGQGRCWGSNRGGRLGYGRFGGPVELPVAVRNVTDTGPVRELRRIDAASYHTCALRGAGRAWCWGGNSLGQLGVGDTTTRPQPVVVRAPNGPGHLERVVDIDVGTFHTCALTADGRVWCWGTNFDGRLGDGTTIERRRPAAVRVAAP